ncbi:hypothetical protein BX666DRAFT_1869556 [Dichotomocladium elegans]|nr:hypothetical protein BX666DRAFT_1869556 [Dichotomocladium elegans]
MTTPIGLPIGDIQHALWIANLPTDALQHWHTPDINLVVITDRRPHALSRLFASAERSHYLGDKVNLVVNLEQSSDRTTRMLVNSFSWRHGDKVLRHRIRKGGLMPAIIESWYPKGDDDYAVILEDDVEVSPLFYVWAKYSILQYRYHRMGNPELEEFRKRLYGVSLYSPRNLELHPAGRRPFHPDNVLLNMYPPRMPYVSQVPCSWGAVYFPEHWREFHEYLTIRLMDLNQDRRLNVTVPNSRSARWKKSWKKYYIELVFLRAYVMLYPNFQEFESFSTNHLETGTHVKSTTKRMSAISSFLVPLMQRDTILSQLPNQRLPDYAGLPVLDLWGYLQTHDTLDETAAEWHAQVSACKRRPGHYDPQDILCPFETPPPAEPVRPKRVKFKYAIEPLEYVYTTRKDVVYDPDLDGPKAIDVATMSSEPDDGSILWDDADIDFIRGLPWTNQLYNPVVSFDQRRDDLQDLLRADAELDFD